MYVCVDITNVKSFLACVEKRFSLGQIRHNPGSIVIYITKAGPGFLPVKNNVFQALIDSWAPIL